MEKKKLENTSSLVMIGNYSKHCTVMYYYSSSIPGYTNHIKWNEETLCIKV